jgi:hypothetical protein
LNTGGAALPPVPLRANGGLRAELADFFAFVRRPRLGRRMAASGARVPREWMGFTRLARLLRWAMLLWLVNLIVFMPLALGVASLTGAQAQRLESVVMHLAWWKVLVLLPVLEELIFRYFLRRPALALWFVPALLAVMFASPPILAWGLALLLCLAGFMVLRRARALRCYFWPWRAMRRYVWWFPVTFHLAALVFALGHLGNYSFSGAPRMWAMLPLLVLPQWLAGLVLGWMRVRLGIGASMALHCLYNAGPIVLLWLVARHGAQM